nr:probable WRKY transcription factor 2 [Tanacetum cinerariifolium]
KVEAYASDVISATRAIREPRVMVQTTSEVDIDGFPVLFGVLKERDKVLTSRGQIQAGRS